MHFAYIYGRHAVKGAIEHIPDRVQAVYVSIGAEKEFEPIAKKHHIRLEALAEHDFRAQLEGAVHQGVVAKIAVEGLVREYDEFVRTLKPDPSTVLVLLNEVTDPHNVGAIIRSAAAFGASGVLLPLHNQAQLTAAAIKASAGMAFALPIVAINNENQTILDLKKKGFWIYGLAAEGANNIHTEKFDTPAVFVVGSEGEGMREKTREHCDILLTIPMHDRAESLNASVSAAVVLSEWSKQHPEAL